MGTKKDSRRAKKREKKRKKRQQARASRGSRQVPGQGGGRVSVDTALRWPVGECYLSQGWDEQGARAHAVFSRRSRTGRVALAVFEVDLAERGVLSASLSTGVADVDLQLALAEISSEDRAMIAHDPPQVVRLVTEGRDHGREAGHAQHPAAERAMRLFGDVDPSAATQPIPVGDEPPEPESSGLLDSLKSRLFGG